MPQFIHDPLLTWRLTNAASPTGPNFKSERENALAIATGAGRARRQSILEGDLAPSELLQGATNGDLPTRTRARTNSTAAGTDTTGLGVNQEAEIQNARAVEVLDRVQQKLTGRDFKTDEELDYVSQVNKLLMEATRHENLCQHYIGWCSFW